MLTTAGYYYIDLRGSERGRVIPIHRLVAEAFISNPNSLPCVNHVDGNKLNNGVENLEWCTFKQNSQHALRIGLTPTGEDAFGSTLRNESINEIISKYNSGCKVKDLAMEYEVRKEVIATLVRGKTYKYLPKIEIKKRNDNFKLKDAEVECIRDWHARGVSAGMLSKMFQVSHSCIQVIVKNRRRNNGSLPVVPPQGVKRERMFLESDIKNILRKKFILGIPINQIRIEYNSGYTTINNIIQGKTYTEISSIWHMENVNGSK